MLQCAAVLCESDSARQPSAAVRYCAALEFNRVCRGRNSSQSFECGHACVCRHSAAWDTTAITTHGVMSTLSRRRTSGTGAWLTMIVTLDGWVALCGGVTAAGQREPSTPAHALLIMIVVESTLR